MQFGLILRVMTLGKSWSKFYIKIMAELLVFFTPETVLIAVNRLGAKYPEACSHCLNAALYIAVSADGVMRRDACRFLIYNILGVKEPERIRKIYRMAILGPTAVGSDGFENLELYILEEMERLNPYLIHLIAKQQPLSQQELEWARNITMARFTLGVDRDPEPQKIASRNGLIKRIFKKFSISR